MTVSTFLIYQLDVTGKKLSQVLLSPIPRLWNDPAYTHLNYQPPLDSTSCQTPHNYFMKSLSRGFYPAIAYDCGVLAMGYKPRMFWTLHIRTRPRIVLGVLSVSVSCNELVEVHETEIHGFPKMGKFVCARLACLEVEFWGLISRFAEGVRGELEGR
jgi:hypothetical protein